LRERKEEIPMLCQHFIKSITPVGEQYVLPKEEIDRLLEYEFTGNVRELKNIIERSILLSENSILRPSYLVRIPLRAYSQKEILSLSELESSHISQTLEAMGGNLSRTAKVLGISLSTLKRKLKLYELR
jgi:two-component system NtrC family response regulator